PPRAVTPSWWTGAMALPATVATTTLAPPARRSLSASTVPSDDGGRLRDLEALVAEARSFLARFDPDRHPVEDVRRAMGHFSTLANLATAGVALGAPRLAPS